MLTHDNYLEQCAAVTPVFPFWPGARYLSIIPTNHAIDFMGGFLMPFTGGGTVVHLRTLRPEFIREAFTKYKITYMAVVPLILKNLQRGLREKFAALPPAKRKMLDALIGVNRALTRGKPRPGLSRMLLKDVHKAFGGGLQALLVGGAFTEPATIEFFHDIGIPIYNGYGCTEACTAITLNDLRPFRPDTVGKPVRGMEIRIVEPDADGIGEVAVRSKTVMSAVSRRSRNDGGNHREWLAHDRRPRPRRRDGPFATFRAQEKHDRHRRREKYLSRRHRKQFRGDCGEGVLRLRGELHLAAAYDDRRATRAGASSRTGTHCERRAASKNFPGATRSF